MRLKIDGAFDRLRDGHFKNFITWITTHRSITIVFACSLLAISAMMVNTGIVKFNPDMDIEFNNVELRVRFHDDISEEEQKEYGQHLSSTLTSLKEEHPSLMKQHIFVQDTDRGFIYVYLDLVEKDVRIPDFSNAQMIEHWKSLIKPNEIVREITSSSDSNSESSSSTNFVSFRVQSDKMSNLRSAVSDIKQALAEETYLSDITDNFRERTFQINVKANPLAESLGMNDQYLSAQSAQWLNTLKLMDISRGVTKSAINIGIDQDERKELDLINRLPITAPDGSIYTLAQLTEQERDVTIAGFRIFNGQISADVYARITDENLKVTDVSDSLIRRVITPIMVRHNVTSELAGSGNDIEEVIDAMKTAIPIAIGLIYLILAWIFQSWVWPMAVVAAIPFAMTGSIFGHWVMGADFTFLSILGLFGVAGIVVNDSIILIDRFRQLLEQGMAKHEAIVATACQRFRAVLLTSITTVIGLVPILFETSVQAQIVKTMAISLAFGLLYGTFVVLVLTPCLMSFVRAKKTKKEQLAYSQ